MYQYAYYPYRSYPPYRGGDQRFFPFFGLPFLAGGLAGLAISPLLFNRPCYGPACYPPYPPYGGYPYPSAIHNPMGSIVFNLHRITLRRISIYTPDDNQKARLKCNLTLFR